MMPQRISLSLFKLMLLICVHCTCTALNGYPGTIENINLKIGEDSTSRLTLSMGQTIKLQTAPGTIIGVTLQGPSTLLPYGVLMLPDGTQEEWPAADRAQNGYNTAESVFSYSGQYLFTVQDQNNSSGIIQICLEGRGHGDAVDPDPDSPIISVLTDSSEHILASDTLNIVYGCEGQNNLTVQRTAVGRLIHFPGHNVICFESDSDIFTVSRSGATVEFQGTDGTALTIPATTTAQSIVFNNGTWNLAIVSGRVMLGEMEIDQSPRALSTEINYAISGTITPASGSLTDSDVNDPNAPYAPNDTINQAQVISNPAIVGGYVNEFLQGENGRSFYSGDRDDFYLVQLMEGDEVFLSISDYHNTDVDLDLYLYDPTTEEIIDGSSGVSDSESLIIAREGYYAVNVYAYEGASNYVLSIGRPSGNAAVDPLRLGSHFVPGEIIVHFKDSLKSSMAALSTAAMAETMGMQYKAGNARREMLMTLGDDDWKRKSFKALGIETSEKAGAVADATTQKKLDTIYAIKALRKKQTIKSANPNYLLKPCTTPNDPLYQDQWHYQLINLPDAWEITRGSASVVVAVIDTGVLLDHPDLQGNLTHNGVSGDGYDFIQDADMARDGDGIDSNPYDVGDLGSGSQGSTFHGTHVAGTVSAVTDNNLGVAGVGWNTRIMPLRVLGVGGGTSYDIVQAIRYAAGLPNDSNTLPSHKADIINLSLGGGSYSQDEQDVCTLARNAGVIIVAAAGNENSIQPSYPASYDGVVSVSAVDMNSNIAPYSNYGPYIDVAAPGGDMSRDLNGDGYTDGVLSTLGNLDGPDYRFYEGTSMAAPHVAGVAALMKAVHPDLTPGQFDAYLQSAEIVNDLGVSGRDNLYGYGLIDALKGVSAVQGGGTPSSLLQVYPAVLNFGWTNTAASLTTSIIGTSAITVTSVTDNASWLTVAGEGSNIYRVTINRSDLSGGWYHGEITFVSTENTVKIPVTMQVSPTSEPADAGYHYILLVDAQTRETLVQETASPIDGIYSFTFTDLSPEKRYLIYAGTDADNDYFIGDEGEAFGMYRTIDQPGKITLDSPITHIDFFTGFNIVLPGTLQTNESFQDQTDSAIPRNNKRSICP